MNISWGIRPYGANNSGHGIPEIWKLYWNLQLSWNLSHLIRMSWYWPLLCHSMRSFIVFCFSCSIVSSILGDLISQIHCAELLEEAGHFFTRPVTSLWLSLAAVCQQLIGQYPAMSFWICDSQDKWWVVYKWWQTGWCDKCRWLLSVTGVLCWALF